MCQHRRVTNAPDAPLTEPHGNPPGRRWRLVAAALALVVLSCLVGMAWGQRNPVVHVDEATCLALEAQIGCVLPDGWDIEVPTDLPWTDARGAFHESGRPECLPPTGRGASEPVLLDWLETASDRRYVLEVTCRS